MNNISLNKTAKAIEFHPFAELFPFMEEKELDDLCEDIRKHGQRESIKLLEGQILDGRNRYQACLKAGIEPLFQEEKIEKPLEYVLSLNLHRRHLDESQRAIVAAKISKVQICTSEKVEKISQKTAAEMMNVSLRSVASAAKVQEKGIPELCKAVENGDIPVSVAALISEFEPHKQGEIAAMDKKSISKALEKETCKKPKVYDISICFTDEEMKKVDAACRRVNGGNRAEFIHEAVMHFCANCIPPTKAQLREYFVKNPQFSGKKKFIKKNYSAKQLKVGKNGMSKEESDIQKEYDDFVANLPTASQKMNAESIDNLFERHLAR